MNQRARLCDSRSSVSPIACETCSSIASASADHPKETRRLADLRAYKLAHPFDAALQLVHARSEVVLELIRIDKSL